MTVPFSYTQSPFLFHHVPNSPFLLSTSRPATQSPIPLVPDVELARNNNYSSNDVLRNGKPKCKEKFESVQMQESLKKAKGIVAREQLTLPYALGVPLH